MTRFVSGLVVAFCAFAAPTLEAQELPPTPGCTSSCDAATRYYCVLIRTESTARVQAKVTDKTQAVGGITSVEIDAKVEATVGFSVVGGLKGDQIEVLPHTAGYKVEQQPDAGTCQVFAIIKKP